MDEADQLFSYFIRQLYAGHGGQCRCATCGLQRDWRDLSLGHYQSRRHMATRFMVENAGPQCGRCNGLEGGRDKEMASWLDTQHGEGTAKRMRALAKQDMKWPQADLEAFRAALRDKMEALHMVLPGQDVRIA